MASAETSESGTEILQMKRRDLEAKNYEGDSVVSLLLSRCVSTVGIVGVLC